ncbi:MAG: type II toxin-antitoxin system VapC family toxin [Myxococcales bacterium]|nr:type II toxin-antitoxin system VapC family toxin [Myxococcales bacterium]
MKYLLDTDAVSEPARRRPSARFLKKVAAHSSELAISSVTVGEIVFGARRVAGGERYLDYLRDAVLPHMPVLPIDLAVASRYGEVRATLEAAGKPLPDLDLLIAATALAHGLELVTGNHRHFRRVAGLELPDWFGDRKGT